MERMKDGDIIAFNGVVYKYCTGGTCLQCSLRNTRLCDHLKCFNGEHFEVLKGAAVVEMPSEEEMLNSIPSDWSSEQYMSGAGIGWHKCYDWLKSKIMK